MNKRIQMKQHSTVSNKERMKATGLEKTDTEVSRPGYRDLDEVMASPEAVWRRPWWVRTVEKPTTEVDWDGTERFDVMKVQQISWRKYVGEEEGKRLMKLSAERTREWLLEKKSGYTLRDRALTSGSLSGTSPVTFRGTWAELPTMGEIQREEKERKSHRVMAPGSMKPPNFEEMGTPRYEGSPEENSRLIRAAARHYGASQIGFVELNENHRKLIYARDGVDGKLIEFENIDEGYETEKKRVIPEKARWVIVFSVQMSEETLKVRDGGMSTAVSSATHSHTYGRGRNVMDSLQTFLHVLGYQGLSGTWYNGLGIAPALGAVAGLGEIGRTNQLISPEYGLHQRLFRLVTDLPLAVTKPIDAGIRDFCRVCKSCAEKCPSGSLSMETEPTWTPAGPWNNPGHKTWFENGPTCMSHWRESTVGCSTCYAVCPYGKKDISFIHAIVKATIARNPVFRDVVNNLMVRMDELFGYQEPRDGNAWWDLNLPPFGQSDIKGSDLE
jgi:reductive dehalogenase